LDILIDELPGTFAVVEIHTSGQANIPWGNTRKYFYNITGTPTSWFDGTVECRGAHQSVQQMYDWYKGVYNSRRNRPTDVTIELSAKNVGEQSYEFTARVCMEKGGSAKNVRIYMVEVLDNWPVSPSYSRNTVRQAATTQDISLSPGDCQEIVRRVDFDDNSWNRKEDIKIIAWAQAPLSSAPAEVYQAAESQYPFLKIDCNKIKKHRSKCKRGGIKGKIRMKNKKHNGAVLTVTIDGIEEVPAEIVGKKAKYKDWVWPPGEHQVAVTAPNCPKHAKIVECE